MSDVISREVFCTFTFQVCSSGAEMGSYLFTASSTSLAVLLSRSIQLARLSPFLLCCCSSCLCTHILSLKSPTIMFPVVLLPSCSGMYVRTFSSSLNISTHVLFSPSPPLFFVFISPFLHLCPSHFFCLPAYLRQECKFLQFKVLGWAFSEENQKKKYRLKENKSHSRAEPFSENCMVSVNWVHFFFFLHAI